MRGLASLALCLSLAACSDHRAKAPGAPAPAAPAAPATPALPADAAAAPQAPAPAPAPAEHPTPQPLTIDDAIAHLPKLQGDAMIPVKTTPDGTQAHGTWCLAGASADAVAESLGTTLTAAGYTDVATRGDATKAGVSGERDGYRLSYVVSASTAASCRAPGHYFASATLFKLK